MTKTRNPMLPVADIDTARRFYTHVLGCRLARRAPLPPLSDGAPTEPEAPQIHLELFGLPLALQQGAVGAGARLSLLLGVDDWCTLSERLREYDVPHEVENARRFSVEPGEQCTILLADPDGNTIELRGFAAEETQLAA